MVVGVGGCQEVHYAGKTLQTLLQESGDCTCQVVVGEVLPLKQTSDVPCLDRPPPHTQTHTHADIRSCWVRAVDLLIYDLFFLVELLLLFISLFQHSNTAMAGRIDSNRGLHFWKHNDTLMLVCLKILSNWNTHNLVHYFTLITIPTLVFFVQQHWNALAKILERFNFKIFFRNKNNYHWFHILLIK